MMSSVEMTENSLIITILRTENQILAFLWTGIYIIQIQVGVTHVIVQTWPMIRIKITCIIDSYRCPDTFHSEIKIYIVPQNSMKILSCLHWAQKHLVRSCFIKVTDSETKYRQQQYRPESYQYYSRSIWGVNIPMLTLKHVGHRCMKICTTDKSLYFPIVLITAINVLHGEMIFR